MTGDLTLYISAYFDTQLGAKAEVESYGKIATAVSYEPKDFLFLSDSTKEIEAAQSAGMQALLCEREGHSNAGGAARMIHDFNGIFPG